MADQPGIVLYNKSKFKPFQASMYHSIVCAALGGGCLCTHKEQTATVGSLRLEASFRIPPKSYSEILPEEVLLLPQVKTAMKGPRPQLVLARELQVVERVPATMPTPVPGSIKSVPPGVPSTLTKDTAPVTKQRRKPSRRKR